ncbi:MAG: LytTR family DNA-binding domain-containing protein [Lachnospiraceae bacterium]|nr:LytTR family DNA-binding domain-containing protein [Lachnospiraceae bacterium]
MTNVKRVIKIAICDCNEEIIDKLKSFLKIFMEETAILCNMRYYSTGEQLLQDKEDYDVLFLALSLPDYDGIELGSKLRHRGEKCRIIMNTDHEVIAIKALEIEVSRVLVNPFSYDTFKECFAAVIKRVPDKERRIQVKDDSGYMYIDSSQIEYVSVYGNYVRIHLLDGKICELISSLSRFIRELNDSCFAKCHQSFGVNVAHINKIAGTYLVMNSGAKLSVSRSGKKAILNVMEKFCESLVYKG